MIPSILATQVRKGVEDFLTTTFPISTPFFHGAIDRLIDSDGGLFKGPYISIKLPFRAGKSGPDFFADMPMPFPPHLHQETAFVRRGNDSPRSTIVATGTGSGKTECFLYPILNHCLQARRRGQKGIKAIIIYPMNALATDQAKRIPRSSTGTATSTIRSPPDCSSARKTRIPPRLRPITKNGGNFIASKRNGTCMRE